MPAVVRKITPLAAPTDAVVPIPGSKSLTNRALIIASLAQGATRLSNALFSDDTVVMVDSLRRLGFAVDVDSDALRMVVHGRLSTGRRGRPRPPRRSGNGAW